MRAETRPDLAALKAAHDAAAVALGAARRRHEARPHDLHAERDFERARADFNATALALAREDLALERRRTAQARAENRALAAGVAGRLAAVLRKSATRRAPRRAGARASPAPLFELIGI